MLSGVAVARALGPSQRGDLAAAVVWSSVLAAVLDLGLGPAFAFFAGKGGLSLSKLNSLTAIASLAFGGIAALGLALILPPSLDLSGERASTVRTAAVSIPVAIWTGHQAAMLLGRGHVGAHNLVRLFFAVCYGGGAFALWRLGHTSPSFYAWSFLIAHVCTGLLACALVTRQLAPGWTRDLRGLRPVFAFAAKTQAAAIASHLTLRVDQLLLSLLLPPSELGYYAVAVAVSSIILPAYTAFAQLASADVVRATRADDGVRASLRLAGLAQLFSVPIVVMGAVFMPALISSVFGASYLPAVPSARLLLFASIVQGTTAILSNSLRALGQPGRPAIAEIAGCIATFGLLAALLPRLASLGAAVASLVAYSLVATMQLILLRRASTARLRDLPPSEIAPNG